MTESERESIGRLYLPVNRPVKITLTSEDVIHDFGVPAFRSKIDVLPGRYTTAWYHPTKIGEYHIFCDQYCGTWHSLMVGKIEVLSEDDYQEKLQVPGRRQLDRPARPQGVPGLNCIECHTGEVRCPGPVAGGALRGHEGSPGDAAGRQVREAEDHGR